LTQGRTKRKVEIAVIVQLHTVLRCVSRRDCYKEYLLLGQGPHLLVFMCITS
jgi:hypothetical protein